eukprot:295239-Amphidinium_carterae.1
MMFSKSFSLFKLSNSVSFNILGWKVVVRTRHLAWTASQHGCTVEAANAASSAFSAFRLCSACSSCKRSAVSS